MTIRTRVTAIMAGFVFVTVSAAALSLHYLLEVQQYRTSSLQSQSELMAATDLRSRVRNQLLESFQEILDARMPDLHVLDSAAESVANKFRSYESAIAADTADNLKSGLDRTQLEEERELLSLKLSYGSVKEALDQALALRRSGRLAEAKSVLLHAKKDLFEKDFLVKITHAIDAEAAEAARNGGRMFASAAALKQALIGLVVIAVLKAIFLVIFLSKSVLSRLNRLLGLIKEISSGNLNPEFPVTGNDEISALFAALRRMAHDLKQANSDLKVSHQKYQQILDSTSEGVWRVDEEMVTIFVNPQMAAMLGYEVPEMLGRHLDDFMDQKERARRDKEMQKQRSSRSGDRIAGEFRRKDGTTLYAMLSTNPVYGTDGNYCGAVAMISDVTAQRRVEEQLRQAQKMEAVGQLAGGIAHDFNNILGIVLMQADLMLDLDPKLDPDAFCHGIREIRDSAERAAALTKQLLVFSRKKTAEPQVLSLNCTVREMSKMITRLVGEDIKLSTDLANGLANVKLDPVQLQQVIMNLVVNARDAMPTGGSLALCTRNLEFDQPAAQAYDVPPGSYVCLTVTDSGVGMDEEVKKRIFEPFFTTKGVGKGTGLGLATVFGIVKQAGGHINVYSEPGKGTSFKVLFPRVEDRAALPAKPATCTELDRKAGSILLLEDEPALQTVTRDMLVRQGYRVRTAGNGREALENFGNELGQFDLVLTDVIMPEMNGPEFVRKIADARKEYGIKVLFLSGFSDGKLDAHGISSVNENFMEKPYSMKDLLEKIEELIPRNRCAG